MSIPLDRLYHYIRSVAQDICGGTIVIYRFSPHGSKNITDLERDDPKYTDLNYALCPTVVCHDQEPLNFNLYKDVRVNLGTTIENDLINGDQYPRWNLRRRAENIYDHYLLVHSELRSSEVETYKNNYFLPVYYWSHAIISRDWFRFAEHIRQNKDVKKLFLIYNRAWSGTREYRLKFADLLIEAGLVNDCLTSLSFNDSNVYYKDYRFKNLNFVPNNNLEDYFESNFTTSCYSADFNLNDYESTEIEVVLETMFDDSRLHLTEKILRPIACGQPFILVSTSGSLEYLKSYGFKTFDNVINESYDTVEDPAERLIAVTNTMREISQWTDKERTVNLKKLKEISDFNKNYFFSDEFFHLVENELKQNLTNSLNQLEELNTSSRFFEVRKQVYKDPQFNQHREKYRKKRKLHELVTIIKKARSYYNRHLNK